MRSAGGSSSSSLPTRRSIRTVLFMIIPFLFLIWQAVLWGLRGGNEVRKIARSVWTSHNAAKLRHNFTSHTSTTVKTDSRSIFDIGLDNTVQHTCLPSVAPVSHFDHEWGSIIARNRNAPFSTAEFFAKYTQKVKRPEGIMLNTEWANSWPIVNARDTFTDTLHENYTLKGVKVVLVTDSLQYTPFRAGRHADLFAELAISHAAAGAEVSVLLTRMHELNAKQQHITQQNFQKHGVVLSGLSQEALEWGGSSPHCEHAHVVSVPSSCWQLVSCRIAAHFGRLTPEEQPDFIHFPQQGALAWCSVQEQRLNSSFLPRTALALALSGSTQWQSLMQSEPPDSAHSLILRYYERKTAEMAQVLWSPSEYMAAFMLGRMAPVRRPIWVMPNPKLAYNGAAAVGLPSATGHCDSWQQGASRESPAANIEFVFVGQLSQLGGLDAFLGAVQYMRDNLQIPTFNITFLASRTVDSVRGDIMSVLLAQKEFVKEWGLYLTVEELRTPANAVAYLRASKRVAVFPGLTEHLSLIFDACEAEGIPFLVSAAGGLIELVPDDIRQDVGIRSTSAGLGQALVDIMHGSRKLHCRSLGKQTDPIRAFAAVAQDAKTIATGKRRSMRPERPWSRKLTLFVFCPAGNAPHLREMMQASFVDESTAVFESIDVMLFQQPGCDLKANPGLLPQNAGSRIKVKPTRFKEGHLDADVINLAANHMQRDGTVIFLSPGSWLRQGWASRLATVFSSTDPGKTILSSAFFAKSHLENVADVAFVSPPIFSAAIYGATGAPLPLLVMSSTVFLTMGKFRPGTDAPDAFTEFVSAAVAAGIEVVADSTPYVFQTSTAVGTTQLVSGDRPRVVSAQAGHALASMVHNHVDVSASWLLAMQRFHSRVERFFADSNRQFCNTQGCAGFTYSYLPVPVRKGLNLPRHIQSWDYPPTLIRYIRGQLLDNAANSRIRRKICETFCSIGSLPDGFDFATCHVPQTLSPQHLSYDGSFNWWHLPSLPASPLIQFHMLQPRIVNDTVLMPMLSWQSNVQGDIEVSVLYELPDTCGDGGCLFLLVDGHVQWRRCGAVHALDGMHKRGSAKVHLQLRLDSTVSLLVDPLNNDKCDDIHATLQLRFAPKFR